MSVNTRHMSASGQESLLSINDLSIAYEDTVVLSDISFCLEKGQIGSILGPSGCGKTSLLRAIAGFLPLSQGSISINAQIISSNSVMLAPVKRSIGLVFQDFALFPHMTVRQNVEFGLQSLAANDRAARANEYMQITGIATLAEQYPAQLSGGQQQRVAIARAIAPQPDLLLMDEAFSSLDPTLREQVAHDMRGIIKKLGLTALLVTHDQSEAFAFADVIAVVAEQKLQQFASAYELYHEPATYFVANFIGEGAFLNGKVKITSDQMLIETAVGDLLLHRDNHQALDNKDMVSYESGQSIRVLLRPDDIIHDDASPVKAKIVGRNFRGAHIRYTLELPGSHETVLCFAPSHHDHAMGESFGIRAEVEHIIHFES